jgi:hypothetical protein
VYLRQRPYESHEYPESVTTLNEAIPERSYFLKKQGEELWSDGVQYATDAYWRLLEAWAWDFA